MWKLLLRTYGKWVLLFGLIIILTLSIYAIYFAIQYPQIRKDNYIATLDTIEDLLAEQKGSFSKVKDVDFDYAVKTVQRMKELIKSDQLVYQDFSKTSILIN